MMGRRLWAVCVLLLLLARSLLAQQPAQTGDYMTRTRQGPGYGFPLAFELLPHSNVLPLAVSPDGAWVQIESANQQAWVELNALLLPPTASLIMKTDIPPAPVLPAENCISLTGDSVPYGSVVYIVPGHGFAILRTQPIGEVLQETLLRRGLGYLQVRDHSAEAAFLSEDGKFPYSETEEYAALAADRCRLTLVMPWINDLSVERPDAANAHIADLVALITTLRQDNPNGEIILLGFYYGQPSEFAQMHAPGYVEENISAFNTALFAACADEEQLGSFVNLHCMETASLFIETDNSHVALGATRDELSAILYEPIPADVQGYFDVYWRDNPNGQVFGDGVHLSEKGKKVLVQALVDELLALNPDL